MKNEISVFFISITIVLVVMLLSNMYIDNEKEQRKHEIDMALIQNNCIKPE
jgi:hypothetical protein